MGGTRSIFQPEYLAVTLDDKHWFWYDVGNDRRKNLSYFVLYLGQFENDLAQAICNKFINFPRGFIYNI